MSKPVVQLSVVDTLMSALVWLMQKHKYTQIKIPQEEFGNLIEAGFGIEAYPPENDEDDSIFTIIQSLLSYEEYKAAARVKKDE